MVKLICIVDDEEDLIENLTYEIKELRPDWVVKSFYSGLDAIKEIMKGQKKEDKGNTGEEDRKDKKKSENADALYLLDLFEKYVE